MHAPSLTRPPSTSWTLAKILTWASLVFLLCMALLLVDVAQQTRADHVAEAERTARDLARQIATDLAPGPPADVGLPLAAAAVKGQISRLAIPLPWVLTVYGIDGSLLAYRPPSDMPLAPIPAIRAWTTVTTLDEDSRTDVASVDDPQIWAWKHVPGGGGIVVVSRPLAGVLVDWRRRVLPSFVFGLAALGGLTLLGCVAVKRSRAEQRTQEQLIKSSHALELMLDEKDALLAEIHHRVKNNMQVVVSLLQMEAAQATSDGPRCRFEEMGRRIALIGRIHERVYASERFARMDVAAHLADHAAELAALYGGAQVTVRAEELSCGLDTALPVSLIAHELTTNALRHGGGAAPVTVRLVKRAGRVTLTVSDGGGGPKSARGLGLSLVRALAQQIGAEISDRVGEDGYGVSVSMPAGLFVEGR